MKNIDYDDPQIDEKWCNARRQEVIEYLKQQGVDHGEVGEWPAWHAAPYLSIWAIESIKKPGWVGWWVVCGDLPTDYISADIIKHPREALRAFGYRWQEVASYMARGESYPGITIGSSEDWQQLAPLLTARATIFLDFANDDDLWEDQYE